VAPPRTIELRGGLVVQGPAEEVFGLFSPLGEKAWVPGWDPELIHPPGATWERGLVFRTREERGEAIWIVTALDRQRHEVEYHRVEPGRYVARVGVVCSARGERETDVRVSYGFVGLSPAGNEDIARMSEEAYGEKMLRWQGRIAEHLARSGEGGRDRA
jgi:hypothetical protein